MDAGFTEYTGTGKPVNIRREKNTRARARQVTLHPAVLAAVLVLTCVISAVGGSYVIQWPRHTVTKVHTITKTVVMPQPAYLNNQEIPLRAPRLDAGVYFPAPLEKEQSMATENITTATVASELVTIPNDGQDHSIALNAKGLQKLNYCREHGIPFTLGFDNHDSDITMMFDVSGLNANFGTVTHGPAYPGGKLYKWVDSDGTSQYFDHVYVGGGYGIARRRSITRFTVTGLVEITNAQVVLKAYDNEVPVDVHLVVLTEDSPADVIGSSLYTELGTDVGGSWSRRKGPRKIAVFDSISGYHTVA
jgi:hypothetical protein